MSMKDNGMTPSELMDSSAALRAEVREMICAAYSAGVDYGVSEHLATESDCIWAAEQYANAVLNEPRGLSAGTMLDSRVSSTPNPVVSNTQEEGT